MNKGLSFILLPYLTFNISPDGFASVTLYTILGTFFGTFILCSFNTSYIKFVSTKEFSANDCFFTSIIFILFILLIIILLVYLAKPLLILTDGYEVIYIYLALIIGLNSSVTSILLARLQCEEKSLKYVSITTANSIINIICTVILISYFKFDWEGRIIAVTLSNIIIYPIIIYILIKEVKEIDLKNIYHILKSMFKFGLPLLPHTICGLMIFGIDRFILDIYTTRNNIGVYSFAYQLSMLPSIISSSLNTSYSPEIICNYKNNHFSNIKNYFTKVRQRMLFICLIWVLLCILLINIFFDKSYTNAVYCCPFLIFAYYYEGLTITYTNVFYADNKTKFVSLFTFINISMNIVFNFILISIIGIIGASIATFLSYFITCHIISYYVRKKL